MQINHSELSITFVLRLTGFPNSVIADYPIGYASGFGETLYNLFSGFPAENSGVHTHGTSHRLTTRDRAQSINLPAPSRPGWIPNRISLAYYPFLKAQQFRAYSKLFDSLVTLSKSIQSRTCLSFPSVPGFFRRHWLYTSNIQTKPRGLRDGRLAGSPRVSPASLFAWRRRLFEVINRANVRFAVSREMAAHYEETYGKSWLVVHNGLPKDSCHRIDRRDEAKPGLLAGDVNVFRFDAVIAFAEAIERHNQRHGQSIEFTVMGEVAEQHRSSLSSLNAVKTVEPSISRRVSRG